MTEMSSVVRDVAIGALARRIGRGGRAAWRQAELLFRLRELLPPGGAPVPDLTQLAAELGITPSRLSHCLAELRDRGMLVERTETREMPVTIRRQVRVRCWDVCLPEAVE